MNERRKALLEAALLCSKYADVSEGRGQATARYLATSIERLADKATHFYPPGKPVIDESQDPR